MIVKFWGVRGTVPTPGAKTVRYGGNTSCVSVDIDDKVLVLDAGTGIRKLGEELVGTGKEIFVLLSHLHSDHLMGFPLFYPLYEPERRVHLLDYYKDGVGWTPLSLFDGVHFPLNLDYLPCSYQRVSENGLGYLRERGLQVEACQVNHPGGAFGYRVDHARQSFVYIPDNELEASDVTSSFESIAAFCVGADILCHDAQYIDDDLPQKAGWGHSRVRRVCELAIAAHVKHLVLFHHDPERTDEALDHIQEQAQAYLYDHNITCSVAYEGLAIDLRVKAEASS